MTIGISPRCADDICRSSGCCMWAGDQAVSCPLEQPERGQPRGLRGKDFLAAVKAAQSARARGQRTRRARPWQGRGRFAGATGVGIPAPEKTGGDSGEREETA